MRKNSGNMMFLGIGFLLCAIGLEIFTDMSRVFTLGWAIIGWIHITCGGILVTIESAHEAQMKEIKKLNKRLHLQFGESYYWPDEAEAENNRGDGCWADTGCHE